jgi:Uma2 family endonuclease
MAAPTIEVLSAPPTDAQQRPDPFRYGWRYVKHIRSDGTEEFEQVPLTLEDVLHPEVGDFIVHNEAHERRNLYLYDVSRARLADDPTAVVLHDVRIAWNVPGLRAHGPDLAIIRGVREHRNWSTFDVAEEGVRPELIIEVTSPETAAVDRSNKLEEYALAGVPFYVIVDTVVHEGRRRLLLVGYQLTPDGYRVLPPNERGWLWLAPIRAWLGIADDEIVCYDETGQPLGDYRELAAALATAEQRAALAARQAREAEQRAEAAEARVRELEALVARLRETPQGP